MPNINPFEIKVFFDRPMLEEQELVNFGHSARLIKVGVNVPPNIQPSPKIKRLLFVILSPKSFTVPPRARFSPQFQ